MDQPSPEDLFDRYFNSSGSEYASEQEEEESESNNWSPDSWSRTSLSDELRGLQEEAKEASQGEGSTERAQEESRRLRSTSGRRRRSLSTRRSLFGETEGRPRTRSQQRAHQEQAMEAEEPAVPAQPQGQNQDANATPATMVVNGVVINLRQTKAVVTDAVQVLHRKEDRAQLSKEKLADLYEKATQTSHECYDLINLQLDDNDKLEDTYNLEMLVRKTRARHIKFDLHNVFTIVLLDPTDPN